MKIVQRHGLFSTLTHEIAGDEVIVIFKSLTSGFVERYSLFDISDTTERQIRRALKWLVYAGIALVLALTLGFEAFREPPAPPLLGAAFFGVVAAALYHRYLQESWDKVQFRRWKDGKFLFVMWHNQPNAAEFQHFYDHLIERIRKTTVHPKATPEERLKIYEQHLRFLCEQDVMTPEEAQEFFDRSRNQLLAPKGNVISLVK